MRRLRDVPGRAGHENFCHAFPALTYDGLDRHDGSTTLGGYSREYVVRDRFAHPLPAGLDPAAAAPLLCAGITVWEPMRALGVGPATRLAVVGLGGLGHLAVKMAVALGAHTSVVSRSPDKADDARRLGAHDLIVSTDAERMAAARDRFDVVIDTVSAPHYLGPYLRLVAMDGTLSHLGHLGPVTVETTDLLVGRKKLSSAGSGGLRATADVLDFCARHGITADVEILPSARVNEALDRLRAQRRPLPLRTRHVRSGLNGPTADGTCVRRPRRAQLPGRGYAVERLVTAA